MKKKIKNLTKEERERICKKEKSDCAKCPLSIVRFDYFRHLIACCFKDRLEEKVEIPEE